MALRQVEIVVTDIIVDSYEARSYPHEQRDARGYYNLYKVPVYRIIVKGTDDNGQPVSGNYRAPRFMPFYNDPKHLDSNHKTIGWTNAGLSSTRRVVVSQYLKDRRVTNRYSPGVGAIVVEGLHYIHAGPATLQDVGWGSAGCIEIIGNFDLFKSAIARMSGSTHTSSDDAITELVRARKLIVTIQQARVPDINVSRRFHD